MRSAVITAVHGRPRLTATWCKYTQQFGTIYAAVTDGQQDNIDSLLSVGAKVVEVANEPLGAKHNAALELAMRDGWDAAILLPSDDFVEPGYVAAALQSGAQYVFPASCAIYDSTTHAAFVLIHDPAKGFLTFGAGRVVRREALEAVGPLWTPSKMRGLDTDSHVRLKAHGFHPVVVGLGEVPCLTDVKGDEGEQLWPWQTWRSRGKTIEVTPWVRQMIER